MTRFLPNLPSLSLCQRPRVPPLSLIIGSMESKAEDRRVLHTNGFQLSGRGVSFEPSRLGYAGVHQVSRLLVLMVRPGPGVCARLS
jgi:hypothetical protein